MGCIVPIFLLIMAVLFIHTILLWRRHKRMLDKMKEHIDEGNHQEAYRVGRQVLDELVK